MAGLLKAVPTTPELVAGHIGTGPPLIVNGQVVDIRPFASVTLIVNEPPAVGVPVIAPVDVFNVKPGGKVPVATEKVNGGVPPVTVIAGLLNGKPASPELVVGHVS
jgi:hypothetical protein